MTASKPRLRNSSVERTLRIVSDTWSFLILREFYFGARRFDAVQAALRIPRSTLSERLKSLVARGVLRRVQYHAAPARFEYRLTDMGLDLYLVVLSFLRFGDDWLAGDAPPPAILVHARCDHICRPTSCCSACGAAIRADDVRYRDGPGAGWSDQPEAPQRRRSADAEYEGSRPSSVSRTLRTIGDRWSFLILRECFFGVRRYDQIHERLGVATNILADRLGRLVENDILAREPYSTAPPRFEYRLTEKGRALYLPMIEMLRFGDRWLSDEAPLILTHRICGQDFLPVIRCDHCHEPIRARDIRYRLNYVAPDNGTPKPPARID